MAAHNTQGTVPLSDLKDFKVADGAPDVRGWDVKSDDGRKIGEVKELLVSPTERRVRYLCVKLDRDVAGGGDRDVLVPVGVARLDDKHDDVLIPASAVGSFQGLDAYTGGTPTRDYETSLRNRFGAAGAMGAGTDFYAHDTFDENRFYGNRHSLRDDAERRLIRTEEELAVGKRQVQAGEVAVHKHVETEHVHRDVPVTREEVTVERRPITDATHRAGATITDDEIRVPVTEEELVVEKRAVPKEEIVIRKHAVTENRTVDETLRREQVDVDDTTRHLHGDRTNVAGTTGAGLTGAGTTGTGGRTVGQKAADKLDDLKDRVDGNPASRPGPDATDTRGTLAQRAANKADDLKDRVDGNPRSRPGPDATDSDRRL